MKLDKKLSAVLDEQDDVRDQLFESQAPVGRFGAIRLRATCNYINEILSLIGAPYKCEAPTKDLMNEPLPIDMVKGLILIKQMLHEFNEAFPRDAIKEFDVTSLKDDAGLAVAGMAMDALLKSRAFESFLKSKAPEDVEPVTPMATESFRVTPTTDIETELDILK